MINYLTIQFIFVVKQMEERRRVKNMNMKKNPDIVKIL